MAVQTTEEFKDGGATSYAITIEYLKTSDIKVRIDGVLQTYVASSPSSGEYTVSGTTVTLGAQAAAGTGNVHIYRETDVNTAAAVFAAGSSIRAADLNAIHDMGRFSSVEHRNQVITANIKDGQVTSAKIEDGTIVNADINASAAIENTKIADGLLKSGITVNSANIVNGSIVNDDISNSANISGTKLDDGSTPAVKLSTGALPTGVTVASANIVDGTIVDGDIATGTLDNRYYTETELNAGQLDNRYFTETELNAGQLDNRYYTETEAENLFLRQDSSETIASGVSWSGTDSKVATTAAIDLRIVELVDNVGGFVPIANETSFPTENPDINTSGSAKGGTIVSVQTASTNLTAQSGTTLTIANGRGTGNAVIITGVSATIPSGYGFLVETTATDHTYAFHRLVPKATEVATVAANAVNIAAAGANVVNIDSFADRYQISTSAPTTRADSSSLTNGDLWFDSSSNKVMMVYDGSSGDGFSPITPNQSDLTNINIVAGQITYTEDLGLITNAVNTGSGNNSVNTVATNISNVNTAATNIAKITTVADDLNEGTSEIDTVATNIANVNTVGNAIANVNSVAGSIANVNTVQGSISNVNTAATNIASINTTAASIANVNNFTDRYQVASSNPSTDGGGNALAAGDLYFNTSANELKVYTGSAWQGGVTATGNFAAVTGNTFTGNNTYNDNIKAQFGTGNDLQIYHDGTDSILKNTTGKFEIHADNFRVRNAADNKILLSADNNFNVYLYYNNNQKLRTENTGVTVTGLMTATTIDGAAGDNLQLDFGTI